jgi:hypothetical protein
MNSIGQEDVKRGVLWGDCHDFEGLLKELGGYVGMERVAHRAGEHQLRVSPAQRR